MTIGRRVHVNSYYLAAGVLLSLLSLAHAVWGEKKVFNRLPADSVSNEIRLSVYVPWHQVTYLLFASGIALVLAAFRAELVYVPYFILILVVGNLAIFSLICIVKKQAAMFAKTIPQTVAFLLLIALIVLGIVR
jgi:hypothetical protein